MLWPTSLSVMNQYRGYLLAEGRRKNTHLIHECIKVMYALILTDH